MRTKPAPIFLVPLFALCLLFPTPATAGEFSALTLPKGMGMTLAIPSTARFLEAIDAGVAASTVDTRNVIPPGFILEWAAANLPFLAGEGGMDWEMHFFLPPMLDQVGVMGHAVIVANTSLEAFTQALETVGASFSPNPDGSLQMGGRRFPPYTVRDAGDGMIVLAIIPQTSAMLTAQVNAGWRPGRWAKGVIGFAADQPGKWLMTGDFFARKLESIRQWLTREPSTPALDGVDKKVMLAVVDVCDAAVPKLKQELAGIERLGIDIRLDGERLGSSLLIKAGPETLLGKMAAAAAARGNLQNGFARKVGVDSIQLLSTAAWEDILPGSGQLLLECAEKIADAAYPDQKEALSAGIRRFLAGQPGESVLCGDFKDGTISGSGWLAAQDPDALFEAYGEIAEAMNGMFRTAFPGYADAAIVRVEDGTTPGGARYRKIAWDPGFMARYWIFNSELVAVLDDVPPSRLPMPSALQNQSSYLSVGDGFLALVSGPDGETALDAALRAGDAEPAFLDRPAAQQALADLAHRQDAAILIDYDFVTRFALSGGMLNAFAGPGGQPSPDKTKEMFDDLEPKFRKTSSLVGMALGGADDCLIADFLIPTDTISVMIHNFTLIHEAMTGPGTPAFIRDNEANAMSALKNYYTAQITFQIGRQGRVAENTGAGEKGYADNFRNLYFGTAFKNETTNLWLITSGMADAFAGPSAGVETGASVAKPAETAVPFKGYLFLEPPGIDFAQTFGLVAYPVAFGQTGNRVFFIGDEGQILEMDLNARAGGPPAEGEMPALIDESERPDVNPGLWKEVDR